MKNIDKPIEFSKIKKICVIPKMGLGDIIMATSICEALKNKLPHAEIHFIVYAPHHVVLENHPYIDKIYVLLKKRGWGYSINRVKYYFYMLFSGFDVVVDYHNNTSTQISGFISRAKLRSGIKKGKFWYLYNYKLDKGGQRFPGCEIFDLLAPLGIYEQPFRYYYHIRDESMLYTDQWLSSVGLENKSFITFAPGARLTEKKWGMKYWAILGDMVYEQFGLPIVLMYAQNEYYDCNLVYEQMKYKPLLAQNFYKDLNHVAALLTKTKLLVCNDGGLNNLSCTTDTTTIALFRCYLPSQWSPASVFTNHHHLFNPDDSKRQNDSFGISPEDVLAKIKEVLGDVISDN